jgi:hypothetical protein
LEEKEQQQEGDCWQALLLVVAGVAAAAARVAVAAVAPHLVSPLEPDEELEAGLHEAGLEEEVYSPCLFPLHA